MKIFRLIQREAEDLRKDIIFAAALSGIANAGVLAIINAAAQVVNEPSQNFKYLALFVITIAIYIICLRYTYDRTAIMFEKIVHRVRCRLLSKVRDTDLSVIEGLGRSMVYDSFIKETTVISDAQGQLVTAFQGSLMFICIIFYMASLSMQAFLIAMVMIVVATLIYLGKSKKASKQLMISINRHVAFVDSVSATLDGFKELRVKRDRSDDVVQHGSRLSNSHMSSRIKMGVLFVDMYVFSQTFFFILMGVIVFVLPKMIPTYSEVVMELTSAILFIIGPLSQVVGAVPELSKAEAAASKIEELEAALDRGRHSQEKGTYPVFKDFQKLSLDQAHFHYLDANQNPTFEIGPMDLSIEKGEIIFIVGGNGSGKSTFMKLLTSLYYPTQGQLRVDDTIVTRHNSQGFQEMFSVIFSDFHLFKRLYGFRNVDPEKLAKHLKDMELDSKVAFKDGEFTNLDLSTGQKKRLALAVALLEDNPIFVFDEWAADQDPRFRKHFYEDILADLKARKKTVIAVTHDDKYFKHADRVYKMDYGKIRIYDPEKDHF